MKFTTAPESELPITCDSNAMASQGSQTGQVYVYIQILAPLSGVKNVTITFTTVRSISP